MVKTMPNYPSDRMAKRPKTIKIMSFFGPKEKLRPTTLPTKRPKGQKAKRPKITIYTIKKNIWVGNENTVFD